MDVRTALMGIGVLAGTIGVWLGVDALIVTEEEKLQVFVDAIGGEVSPTRISEALSFTDPDEQPITLEVPGVSRSYTEKAPFRKDAQKALSRLYGQRLRIVRDRIVVEGEMANIYMRVVTHRGMKDAEFRLNKKGERWLVSRVRVR